MHPAITETDWVQHKTEDDIATNREIAETVHCMNNSNKSFRLVVLRWKKSACYCYHAIATNAPMSIPSSEVVWRYNKRATQENTIKELKNGFHLRKVPSGNFNANELFFALGVLIHNIFIAQKMFIFPQELVTATIEKIRRIFVVVAGKVIRKSGTTVLQLATTRNKFLEFVAMREMLYDIRNA